MKDPDILFVVLDSLRKDRVSAYSHHRETTPTFDRLADEALLFHQAYTPAPWTLPSHCSMFTGRHPSEHGITNGFADQNLRLPERFPIITESLSKRGYHTFGVSNNPWVGELSNLTRGFDEFVEWDLEISQSTSESVHRTRDKVFSRAHSAVGLASRQPIVLLKRRFFTAQLITRAKRWFDKTDSPTFTFMNLMEAHSPYYPSKEAFHQLGRTPPRIFETRMLNTKLIPYTAGKTTLDESSRNRVLEFYDASARYQDAKLGELIRHLRQLNRFDDMLIIVCADHGKTLGEYDRSQTPPHYLRDINTNVPLLVKFPGQEVGDHVTHPFELTRLFDLMIDPMSTSLISNEGVALIEDSIPHTARSSKPVTRWKAITDGQQKYIKAEDGEEYLFRGNGVSECVEDTEEIPRYLVEAMEERLRELRQSVSQDEPSQSNLGRNVTSHLEDLGYL